MPICPEFGAGPGRFTILLAAMDARIVVTDLSEVQLDLNARHGAEAGHESAVESRAVLDVCDVSRFDDGEFDAVLAYGGPLSYAFDRAGAALSGLFRVTRPGGPVVASVMSTLGAAYRHFLPGVVDLIEVYGADANDRVLATGDLRPVQPIGSGQHTCRGVPVARHRRTRGRGRCHAAGYVSEQLGLAGRSAGAVPAGC